MINTDIELPSLNEFWKMLRNHDWTFEYSDDGDVWRKGRKQYEEIQKIVKNGSIEHVELYTQYSDYAWGRTKVQPSMPARTRKEQLADQETVSNISYNLDTIVKEVYQIEKDQIISAEQLWKIVNPASSILYKMYELVQEKNSGAMKDTITTKGYKKIQVQLEKYCN